jgi:uncharacterized membrane protein
LNDLLSAASLLLAVVGILYGLWYPEIMAILGEEVPKFPEDRKSIYHRISSTLFSRAVPLTITALLVALVFLPDSIKIIVASVTTIQGSGSAGFLATYDAVRTAFCAVEILTIGISIHAAILTFQLIYFRLKRNPHER